MKRVWLALSGLLVAAGCQAPPPKVGTYLTRPPQFVCVSGGPCEVTVIVTACSDTGIRVEPEYLGLRRAYGNVPITWKLETTLPNLVFAGNGIWFKPTTTQFINGAPAANGKQFKWVGVNTAAGEFPYGIKILRTNGSLCAEKDPSVINDVPDGYQ